MTFGAVALIALAAIIAAIGLHSLLVAPYAFRETALTLRIPLLPLPFDGYVIVAIADPHHTALGSPWPFQRIVGMTALARPDFVVLLGDYGLSFKHFPRLSRWLYQRAFPALSAALSSLHPPDGMVGVLGNHDHYYDDDAVIAWLRSIGARALVNECITIDREGATLVIAGVDDALEGEAAAERALAGCPPDAPTIVLSHNPDGVLSLPGRRRVDLVLAGHTHGGQFRIPFIGAVATFSKVCTRRTASGWVPNTHAPLYVSSGVGAQLPGRFLTRPELVVITLRRAEVLQQPV